MSDARAAGFGGRLVVVFESRRAAEMASLVERHGGVPVRAPALREVPLADPEPARELGRALAAGELDALVLMTGVGTRTLAASFGDALGSTLGRARLIVRGPKPAAVLRELGITGFLTAAEPNTWREVLARLELEGLAKAGVRLAVQEHGAPSRALYDALRERGVLCTAVPVYRWALPEDTRPLRDALAAIARGEARIALFTSASQVEHALRVAGEEGIEAEVVAALRRGCVASIGPVCSEALAAEGLPPDIEPAFSKMGHLVKEGASRAGEVLEQKS